MIIEKPEELSWEEVMQLMYGKIKFIVLEDGTIVTNEEIKKLNLKEAEDYGIIVCG